MSGPHHDARGPLDATALRAHLAAGDAGERWTTLTVEVSTGSTNADLAAGVRAGTAGPGAVLVAEEQTAGRGRLARTWTSPRHAGLTVSVLLAPTAPVDRWSWLPLLTGLAVTDAVAAAAGVEARLKWPNDVLVGERKLAGVLAERAGSYAVLGCGLNVSTTAAELPPTATSLALEGATGGRADRGALLLALLGALDTRLSAWEAAGGDAAAAGLAVAYADRCTTLGRTVRVELPGGGVRSGRADAVDDHGRLVVAGAALAAGDVVHVR